MKKSIVTGAIIGAVAVSIIGTAAATVGKQAVEVDYNDIKVSLNGSAVALVDANGNAVEPFAINGTTYLPVRAVSNALGLDVSWDGETSTVILSTPEAQKPTYITRTGSKYHNDSTCNGGTYWEVPYSTAVGMGLTPCDKCVH
jgi:hypothetical protein